MKVKPIVNTHMKPLVCEWSINSAHVKAEINAESTILGCRTASCIVGEGGRECYLCVLLLLVCLQLQSAHRLLAHVTQRDVPPTVDLMRGEVRLGNVMLAAEEEEEDVFRDRW